MRLCVPIPCFFKNIEFHDAIREVGRLGYDAAETYNWKNIDAEKTKRAILESGVELLSMCTSEFRMTDPEYRRAWLEGLDESAAFASKLGAKKLITQVGQDTGAERAVQHEAIVTTLRAAKPILEKYGVTVMIEPLNTYVNHPGYYLTSSREAFDIIKEVDCEFVKVVFDIYHQQIMEGNIIPNVTNNLGLIAHLHAAGHPGRHELQNGENNYNFIFDAIDRAGYTGACGLEYIPVEEPVKSLETAKKLFG